MTIQLDQLSFDQSTGLLPAVIQDASTRAVLMVAYQNREAVEKTLTTGELWFYSRSRSELWHKGATSGNVLTLVDAQPDCDNDTILYQVTPAGPACHTGSETCFGAPGFTLGHLEKTIRDRQSAPTPDSYTGKLLADQNLLFTKISEEAAEVLKAVRKAEGNQRLAEETADLFYHTLVLLAEQGVTLDEVKKVLAARHKGSA